MFEFFSKKSAKGGPFAFSPFFPPSFFWRRVPPSLFSEIWSEKTAKTPSSFFWNFIQRHTSYFIRMYGFLGRRKRGWQSLCTKNICHSYILVWKCVTLNCCPKNLKYIMKIFWNKKRMLVILKLHVSRNNTALLEYAK